MEFFVIKNSQFKKYMYKQHKNNRVRDKKVLLQYMHMSFTAVYLECIIRSIFQPASCMKCHQIPTFNGIAVHAPHQSVLFVMMILQTGVMLNNNKVCTKYPHMYVYSVFYACIVAFYSRRVNQRRTIFKFTQQTR